MLTVGKGDRRRRNGTTPRAPDLGIATLALPYQTGRPTSAGSSQQRQSKVIAQVAQTATPRGCSKIYPFALSDVEITQLADFRQVLGEPDRAERRDSVEQC